MTTPESNEDIIAGAVRKRLNGAHLANDEPLWPEDDGSPYGDYKAQERGKLQPTKDDPLRGLEHLKKVAVVGRGSIAELADRPIVWIWEFIATAGLIVLLAAGPGSGKTTLLFLLVGYPVAAESWSWEQGSRV